MLKSLRSKIELAGQTRAGAKLRKCFRSGTSVRTTTVDDAMSLLDNLLLLSALQLAFSIAAVHSLGHADLVDADIRYSNVMLYTYGSRKFQWGGDPDSYTIISYTFLTQGFDTVAWSFAALALGIVAYLSLSFTECREDESFFKAWWSIWQFVIGIAYIFFGYGTILFFGMTHSFIDLTYPIYSDPPIFNETTNTFMERSDATLPGGAWLNQGYANRKATQARSLFLAIVALGFLCTVVHVAVHRMCPPCTKEALLSETPASNKDAVSELVALAGLVDRGLLTKTEFEDAKLHLLAVLKTQAGASAGGRKESITDEEMAAAFGKQVKESGAHRSSEKI